MKGCLAGLSCDEKLRLVEKVIQGRDFTAMVERFIGTDRGFAKARRQMAASKAGS